MKWRGRKGTIVGDMGQKEMKKEGKQGIFLKVAFRINGQMIVFLKLRYQQYKLSFGQVCRSLRKKEKAIKKRQILSLLATLKSLESSFHLVVYLIIILCNLFITMNNPNKQKVRLPSSIEELKNDDLMKYLQNFLSMETYRGIEQGKDLKLLIKEEPTSNQVKKIIQKVASLIKHTQPPGKVCSLQFLKELMQVAHYNVAKNIEECLLDNLLNVIEYRSNIKSILRGGLYFVPEIDKNLSDDEISSLAKFSNTYFRMSHEILYVWGSIYFPDSNFAKIYQKYCKRCTFPSYPTDFKFFNKQTVLKSQILMEKVNESFAAKRMQNRKSSKEKEKSKIIINEEEEQNEEPRSKIFKKGSKILPRKVQIPPNIIYRDDQYEEVDDRVKEIDKLEQKSLPTKKKHLQLPLRQIEEISVEQTSNENPTNNLTSQMSKNSQKSSKVPSKNTSRNEKKDSQREIFSISEEVEEDIETIVLEKDQSKIGVQEVSEQNFLQSSVGIKKEKKLKKEVKHKKSKTTEIKKKSDSQIHVPASERNEKPTEDDEIRVVGLKDQVRTVVEKDGSISQKKNTEISKIQQEEKKQQRKQAYFQVASKKVEEERKVSQEKKPETQKVQQKKVESKIQLQISDDEQIQQIQPQKKNNFFKRKNSFTMNKTCQISFEGQPLRQKKKMRKLQNLNEVNLTLFPYNSQNKEKQMQKAFDEFSKEIVQEVKTTKAIIEESQNKMNDFRNKLIEEIQVLKSKQNKIEKTKEKKAYFSGTVTPYSRSGVCNSKSARIRRSLSKQKKQEYNDGTLLYVLSKRKSVF